MSTDFGFSDIVELNRAVTQTTTRGANECSMCKKKGLPILPVRYSAIASSKARSIDGVRTLKGCGTFGDRVETVAHKKAKYLLRTLRYGYVNVFYLTTHRWQIYAVTAEGNLYELPLNWSVDRSFEKPFSCTQKGHAQLAQCIAIDDAPHAGTVYLAFSDEFWAKSVRDLYSSNFMGCRDKRMQPFDATGWFNGRMTQPHGKAIGSVTEYLNEYTGPMPSAFDTTLFPYHDRAGQEPALKTAMDYIQPGKGLFFALWDPVGITQELNFEQKVAHDAAVAPFAHGVWAASAIERLKASIEASAEESEEAGARLMQANAYNSFGAMSMFDGGKMLQKQLENIERTKAAEMDKVRGDAWKPYTTHYRQTAIKEFREKMAKALAPEQSSTLVPLSQDHASWLSSSALIDVMQFDYEQGNLQSGVNYANTFSACVEDATDRKETMDVLVKWANGSVLDVKNPLLRGLVLNDPVSAEKVNEASSYPYKELREFVSKLIESYSQSIEQASKTHTGLKKAVVYSLARYLKYVGAPIAEAISSNVEAGTSRVLVSALCMRARVQFAYKAIYGSTSQWVNYVAQQMQQMMPPGQRANVSAIQKQLSERAASASTDDPEVKAKQFVFQENAEQEEAAFRAMSSKQRVASVTLATEAVEKIYIPKFRALTQGEAAFTGIGAIFAIINWRLAREELKKSSRFNRTENLIKLDSAIGGMACAVVQYSGGAVKGLQTAKIAFTASEELGEKLLFWGSRVGAVLSLVSVAIDCYHAWDDYKHGNIGLAALDATSAVIGTVIFLAILANSAFVLPLLIIAAIFGVVMNYFKDREMYDWLERCFFGIKAEDERFPSFREDSKAFEVALS